MKKGQRPSSHSRVIKTRRGRKQVRVNPFIRKKKSYSATPNVPQKWFDPFNSPAGSKDLKAKLKEAEEAGEFYEEVQKRQSTMAELAERDRLNAKKRAEAAFANIEKNKSILQKQIDRQANEARLAAERANIKLLNDKKVTEALQNQVEQIETNTKRAKEEARETKTRFQILQAEQDYETTRQQLVKTRDAFDTYQKQLRRQLGPGYSWRPQSIPLPPKSFSAPSFNPSGFAAMPCRRRR